MRWSGCLALLLAACTGSTWTPSTVGAAEEASIDELDAEVSRAIDILLGAEAIEGVEIAYAGEEPFRVTWVDYRSNGDFVSIRHRDRELDTRIGSGWGIETQAHVAVDGVLHSARSLDTVVPGEWTTVGRSTAADRGGVPLSIPLAQTTLLDRNLPPDTVVSRYPTTDGGEVWELEWGRSGRGTMETWGIHPDGHLALYMVEFSDRAVLPPPADPGKSSPHTFTVPSRMRIELTPLADPEPIPRPEPLSPLDLDIFDVPDLPLNRP